MPAARCGLELCHASAARRRAAGSCQFSGHRRIRESKSCRGWSPLGRARAWRLALSAGLLSVVPFAFWTARNLRTFHIFEPLAPRYATDPGEFTVPGFQRWMKTWIVDFASTSDIYWNVD